MIQKCMAILPPQTPDIEMHQLARRLKIIKHVQSPKREEEKDRKQREDDKGI